MRIEEADPLNFSPLSAYLNELSETVPGYDCILRQGRETLFHQSHGCRSDGLFWFYSATKLFTCTAACRLLERGLLGLEDPVSRYLPEYAHLQVRQEDGSLRPARTTLLIRHLFTMCGGLTYDIMSPQIQEARDRSTRGILRAAAEMPLAFDPGTSYLYSLCHDVLAGVVEVITGQRFSEYVRREIIEPLGMSPGDMTFHPGPEQLERLEPQYDWRGEGKPLLPASGENHFCFSDAYDSGGAGLCGTAEAYILLSEALACGGKGRDGYPLLQPRTLQLMRSPQLGEGPLAAFRGLARFSSYSYGLGVRTRVDQLDGSPAPLGEFGWDGAAGAYTMICPEEGISFLYVQHIRMMGPVYDVIHPRLRDLVWQSLR